jgi:hypothetical protein
MGRHWGYVLAAIVAAIMSFAAPGAASAAQSLAVSSPTGFPAGGHPSYTTTITLDGSAGAPGKLTLQLAPGVLASVSANPHCVTGAPQYTSACQIGSGTASVLAPALPISLTAYLVPPPSSADLVGIDLVTSVPSAPVTHAGAQLAQISPSQVATVLSLDLSSLGTLASALTQMTLTVNGTLGGKPFTRMPTDCSPGSSTLTIAYASKTETTKASPDFAPSGCASLPYHPALTGTAVKDTKDIGAAVSTTVTQGADEAASASTSLLLPWPMLSPNTASLGLQGGSLPVGTATTTTPLLPTPLVGQVFFTGTTIAPTLTIKFPPPAVLTLVGSANLAQSSVTFSGIPDVPVTNLTVTLFGGPKALLGGSCTKPSGTLGGAFSGQNGKTASASRPITLGHCVPAPAAPRLSKVSLGSGRFSARAGTKLKLTLTRAAGVTVVIKRVMHGHLVRKAVLHLRGKAGTNVFKLRLSRLARGAYVAQVSAAGSGGPGSNTVTVRFSVR